MLLRRVLRRRLVRVAIETEVLRRVLRRRGCYRRCLEGAQKALRRQKHAPSQSTRPFACTLVNPLAATVVTAILRYAIFAPLSSGAKDRRCLTRRVSSLTSSAGEHFDASARFGVIYRACSQT